MTNINQTIKSYFLLKSLSDRIETYLKETRKEIGEFVKPEKNKKVAVDGETYSLTVSTVNPTYEVDPKDLRETNSEVFDQVIEFIPVVNLEKLQIINPELYNDLKKVKRAGYETVKCIKLKNKGVIGDEKVERRQTFMALVKSVLKRAA